MLSKDVRDCVLFHFDSDNSRYFSFVSVHDRVMEAGALHLLGGDKRDVLLQQRVRGPGGLRLGHLRLRLRGVLPGDGDLRGLHLGERDLLPEHGLPLHLQQVRTRGRRRSIDSIRLIADITIFQCELLQTDDQ